MYTFHYEADEGNRRGNSKGQPDLTHIVLLARMVFGVQRT